MILTFRELKPIIAKNCKVINLDTIEIKPRYHFLIDFEKLEISLAKAETDLHVLSFDTMMESQVPKLRDIQMFSEYIYIQKETSDKLLNGLTEYIPFMLYSDKNGELWKEKEDIQDITNLELFNKVNVDLDYNVISHIIDYAPIYGVIVTKRFNSVKERFDYNINFKPNQAMNDYFLNTDNN